VKIKIITVMLLFIIVTASVFAAPRRETDDGTPVIEHEIPVYTYYPFGPKIKYLNEKSRLKLFDDLPRVDGATALYPLYSAFVTAVYPPEKGLEYNFYEKTSYILCSRTDKAYQRLLNGEVDIIFCAKPSDNQLEMAKSTNKEFRLIPIGREAFVFFVNKKNPVSRIRTKDIQDIYSGKITNWKDITNIDKEIIAYQRPKNSGSQTILEYIMGDIQIMEPIQENMIGSMGGMFQQVAAYKNYENAIGYSFLFYSQEMIVNDEIKLLALDNVMPNKENIENGLYPFIVDFYAITLGNETENTALFINWILSQQGQNLIENTGYVPIIK
jgi:phosphate transport system substrate-binding protein